jgi:hypothetical protein
MYYKEIENSKVVVIAGLINTTDGANILANTPLRQFISLEFVPDYAILKYVSVMCQNVGYDSFNVPLLINSDIGYTDNNNLISILPEPVNNVQIVPAVGGNNVYFNYCNTISDVHIKLPNFINKMYTFNVSSSSPNVNVTNYLYVVSLTFEFIKYKTPFMLPEFNEKNQKGHPVEMIHHNVEPKFK